MFALNISIKVLCFSNVLFVMFYKMLSRMLFTICSKGWYKWMWYTKILLTRSSSRTTSNNNSTSSNSCILNALHVLNWSWFKNDTKYQLRADVKFKNITLRFKLYKAYEEFIYSWNKKVEYGDWVFLLNWPETLFHLKSILQSLSGSNLGITMITDIWKSN